MTWWPGVWDDVFFVFLSCRYWLLVFLQKKPVFFANWCCWPDFVWMQQFHVSVPSDLISFYTVKETPNSRFFHFCDGALRFLPEKTTRCTCQWSFFGSTRFLFWRWIRVPSIKVVLIDFRHVWHVSSCIYYLYYHKMLQTTISRNHPRTYSYPWWKKSYTTWDL